jgi:hypothetical protein
MRSVVPLDLDHSRDRAAPGFIRLKEQVLRDLTR